MAERLRRAFDGADALAPTAAGDTDGAPGSGTPASDDLFDDDLDAGGPPGGANACGPAAMSRPVLHLSRLHSACGGGRLWDAGVAARPSESHACAAACRLKHAAQLLVRVVTYWT
jgi:hypothetical protein